MVGQQAGAAALPRPQAELQHRLVWAGAVWHALLVPQHARQALHTFYQPGTWPAEERRVAHKHR